MLGIGTGNRNLYLNLYPWISLIGPVKRELIAGWLLDGADAGADIGADTGAATATPPATATAAALQLL
jgi:hypothetical protein